MESTTIRKAAIEGRSMGMQVMVWGLIETRGESASQDSLAINAFDFDKRFPRVFFGPTVGYRTATIPFGLSTRDSDGVVEEFCSRFEELLTKLDAITASVDFWFEETGLTCRVRYVCREANIQPAIDRKRRWQKCAVTQNDCENWDQELLL
jgi:hypothetical protein